MVAAWLRTELATMDTGIPAVAVRLKRIGVNPLTEASNVWVPISVPSVAETCAMPSVSVTTTESDSSPPPTVERNRTTAPPTPSPSCPTTRTRNAFPSRVPIGPLCPSPASSSSPVGNGTNQTLVESFTPLGSSALMTLLPRRLGIWRTPAALISAPPVLLHLA